MDTKKKQLEYFSKILNIGLSNSLVKERPKDYEELMELFKKHPNYPNKIKDVVDIIVVKNKKDSRYYEFNLVKQKGLIDDISYRVCINPRKKNYELLSAMRNSVQPQIDNFRNICPLKCEICKKINTQIQIDHVYMFKFLVKDFLALIDKFEVPNSFDDHIDNTIIFKKEDIDFNNKWFNYHLNNATLRPLCTKCNLSRKKK